MDISTGKDGKKVARYLFEANYYDEKQSDIWYNYPKIVKTPDDFEGKLKISGIIIWNDQGTGQ